MTRKTWTALALAALLAPAARADGWAEKMFADGTSHDFGTVAMGAQLFHRFTITNIYAVRMEITSITPGCGCVTAEAGKRVLEPNESTTLDVSMDASRFKGPKAVIVRVAVGPEFTSSADIKVSAVSRADVVFNGDAAFGAVSRGKAVAKSVDVEYAGTLNWQIAEIVVGKDQPLEASATEWYRKPGKVGYHIKATLKADAPAGPLRELIYLKTNDPASPLVPLLVTADVRGSGLTATPAGLKLGGVKVGEAVVKKVILQSDDGKPFKVLGVDGLDDSVSLGAAPGEAAPAQAVTFKCQFRKPGDFRRELKIKTDLQDEPLTVIVEGTAAP